MALLGVGTALLAVFAVLMWAALPHADGTPRRIAANEVVTSAYAVMLVALLVGGITIVIVSLG